MTPQALRSCQAKLLQKIEFYNDWAVKQPLNESQAYLRGVAMGLRLAQNIVEEFDNDPTSP